MRTFDEIRSRHPEILTFYVDIFNTESVEDFNKKLTESVVSTLRKETAIQKFIKFISHLRSAVNYNPVTSEPEVTLTYRDDWERKTTVEQIFGYLNSLDREMVIAIDEFQQIRKYPGVAMEATLRSIIQFMPKVRFIFCGSRKDAASAANAISLSGFYRVFPDKWFKFIRLSGIYRGFPDK